LKAEEVRLMSKVVARSKRLQAEDPRLSSAASFARAVEGMPNTYLALEQVRRQLSAFGVKPVLYSQL